MVLLRDGAEGHARLRQYDYRANASLVLTSDSRPPRDTHEPSGEAETLWGKIDPKSFGDRLYTGKPPTGTKRKDFDQPQRVGARHVSRRLQHGLREDEKEGVLGGTTYGGRYQPRTERTRLCCGLMLGVVERQLGGQPGSIICGVAHEVLDVLKDREVTNPNDKKEKPAKILSSPSDSVTNNIFDELVSIGNQITDYQYDSNCNADATDDDDVAGVAVDFEEEETGDDENIIHDEDDGDDGDVAEPVNESSGGSGMRVGCGVDGDDDIQEASDGMVINVQDIDAYWLQRKISQAYEQQMDPKQCQELSERVLNILAAGNDDAKDVENKLVQQFQFQFDKLSLIRLLLHNRQRIVWCTRLARAVDQEERKKIEENIMRLSQPDLAAILEQLHASRATPFERQKKLEKRIREEARRLKGGDYRGGRSNHSESTGWFKNQCKLLDLDSLAIQQGRLSSNHTCNFPDKIPMYSHNGYVEIHVPALKAKAFHPEEKLVNVTDMPPWARPAFDGMTRLNRVQSKVYETALFEADNILLCAPTGAEKLMWQCSPYSSRLH